YQVIWRYAYDNNGRRIATLSPQGRVTQVYYGSDYYYDQQYPNADRFNPPPPPWQDARLTMQEHHRFANVLATVRRAQLFTPLEAGGPIYDDTFTAATTNQAGDIIIKYTYEDGFQQRASTSDPRFTTSAAPGFAEPAAYAKHLTVVSFDLTDP